MVAVTQLCMWQGDSTQQQWESIAFRCAEDGRGDGARESGDKREELGACVYRSPRRRTHAVARATWGVFVRQSRERMHSRACIRAKRQSNTDTVNRIRKPNRGRCSAPGTRAADVRLRQMLSCGGRYRNL